jgi:hypothetical protein
MFYVKVTFKFFHESVLVGPCYGLGQLDFLHRAVEQIIRIGCPRSGILLEDIEEKEPTLEVLNKKEFSDKILFLEEDKTN